MKEYQRQNLIKRFESFKEFLIEEIRSAIDDNGGSIELDEDILDAETCGFTHDVQMLQLYIEDDIVYVQYKLLDQKPKIYNDELDYYSSDFIYEVLTRIITED